MNLLRPEDGPGRDLAAVARRELNHSHAMDFRTSLIPIFASRSETLRAIAPGLRDLPAPAFDELQSLLERAEAVIRESVGPVPED